MESTGTQYINTGINPDRSSRIEIDFLMKSYNTSIYGAYQIANNNRVQAFIGLKVSGKNYAPIALRTFGMDSKIINTNAQLNVKYHLVHDIKNLNGTLNEDEIKLTDDGGSNITYPIWLFGANSVGTLATPSSSKIYSYKHYKNDILIQDLIPCLDSNDIPCMYDTVSKQTFYNQGTGEFKYAAN